MKTPENWLECHFNRLRVPFSETEIELTVIQFEGKPNQRARVKIAYPENADDEVMNRINKAIESILKV